VTASDGSGARTGAEDIALGFGEIADPSPAPPARPHALLLDGAHERSVVGTVRAKGLRRLPGKRDSPGISEILGLSEARRRWDLNPSGSPVRRPAGGRSPDSGLLRSPEHASLPTRFSKCGQIVGESDPRVGRFRRGRLTF
jgi:hypothetical protein